MDSTLFFVFFFVYCIIGLSNICRAPFNNCISLAGFVFCLSTYKDLCSSSFDSAPREITVIRKSKHPPGLSFIGWIFRSVHCLWQLALRNGVLSHRPCLYCMLTDNSLWGHDSAAWQRQYKDHRKYKPQKWEMRNSMAFNSFGGIIQLTSKGK